MERNHKFEQLIECLIHVVGRAAVPLPEVQRIVGTRKKQIQAFNMCDGEHTQMQISKATKIVQPNLSRSFDRWVKNGVAFRIGEGSGARLLHIYPIPESVHRTRDSARR